MSAYARCWRAGLAIGWLVLVPTEARAHLDLLSPLARVGGEAGDGQLKSKPCGQTSNGRTIDRVTKLVAGQKLDVRFKEYIDHPSFFTVAFDPDGDDSFPFPRAGTDALMEATDDPKALFPVDGKTVLGVRADDQDGNCAGENEEHTCSISIVVPNVTCNHCTLQVTQLMYDGLGDHNEDNDWYFQCADLEIEPPAATTTSETGGCNFAHGAPRGVPALPGLALALTFLGRRRFR